MKVDLNADAGESYGAFAYGHDREIFPLVTSANLACGFHGEARAGSWRRCAWPRPTAWPWERTRAFPTS